ncbi:MAG TPA: SDR family oxidoreductase, partial [Myxococcaceae bacterium]|nr:SDR family oxidoreductase [Myxococcaceae bacterium]
HSSADREKYRETLCALADLYCQGYLLGWQRLYGEEESRRIGLPTYPFARERYWPETGAAAAVAAGSPAVLHPLLHRNTSDLSAQRYGSRFSGEEFFLRDHVVGGRRVLPGVAYLEMAHAAVLRAAGDEAAASPCLRLKQVVWVRPLVVSERAVDVEIELHAEDDGAIAYEIYSKEGGERVIHSQGRALLGEVGAAPVLDLAAVQSRCSDRSLSAEACYAAFAKAGLEYGPSHRSMSSLAVCRGEKGGREVLARLSLPEVVGSSSSDYVLHPSLVDAALQASLGLSLGEADGKGSLPFALDEVTVYSGCVPRMWAWVRPSSSSSAAVRKLDIDICDEGGRVLVRLSGFSARTAERAVSQPATLLARREWRRAEAPSASGSPYAQHHVVVCGSDWRLAELGASLPEARLAELGPGPEALWARYEQAASDLVSLLQRIVREKPKSEVLIQVVVPACGEGSVFAGLSGLLKTARLENPKLVGQVIGLDCASDSAWVASRLRESALNGGDQEIRYVGGDRLVSGWSELPASLPAAPPWREDGVYLITGGAGGLGLLFAAAIARRARGAQVVLTGRSALDEAKQSRLRALEGQGARVSYRPVDVGDAAAVGSLVDWLRAEFGGLNGILHAAGVLRDSFLVRKTASEVEAVLWPKVRGLVTLDEATRDLPLEFMLLFGSVAGAFGSVGQSDYASANGFLDAYASYRNTLVARGERWGRTVSLSWPLWRDGGMRVDAAKEELLRDLGMSPLPTESGFAALYASLAAGESSVVVLSGEISGLRRQL